jgi:hypothetical protein
MLNNRTVGLGPFVYTGPVNLVYSFSGYLDSAIKELELRYQQTTTPLFKHCRIFLMLIFLPKGILMIIIAQ